MNSEQGVHVVIAGGGVAALEAALALRELASDVASVELLAPDPRFWYRAASVAEPFGLGEARHFELSALACRAGATLTPDRLVSVDSERRLAYTKRSGALSYSLLLIACGALPVPAVEGALSFRGPADTEQIERVLAELERGEVRRVVYAVPAGAVWSLPAYELALMTSSWLADRRNTRAEVVVVTPEEEPLGLFGPEASAAVRSLLEERGITVHTRAFPVEARDGELLLLGGNLLPADRVVALPRLQGPRIGGVPQTFEGFVPVDLHGRVTGMPHVYAAGDITTFPVKQGGIAAQQAEAAAEAMAAEAGVALQPRSFEPVLRGMLLTGDGPRYLRRDLDADVRGTSEVSTEPLWWPPAKIVGRRLAPFLADLTRDNLLVPPDAGLEVEVPLDANTVAERRDRLIAAAVDDALREHMAPVVDGVMSREPLVVAPEDTLGEVAERMIDVDTRCALVAEYGRLIGVLTSGDMLRAIAGRVHPSEARARQWMTADPITVATGATAEAARVVMTEHGIHHLPVVDGERAVGVIGLGEAASAATPSLAVGLGL